MANRMIRGVDGQGREGTLEVLPGGNYKFTPQEKKGFVQRVVGTARAAAQGLGLSGTAANQNEIRTRGVETAAQLSQLIAKKRKTGQDTSALETTLSRLQKTNQDFNREALNYQTTGGMTAKDVGATALEVTSLLPIGLGAGATARGIGAIGKGAGILGTAGRTAAIGAAEGAIGGAIGGAGNAMASRSSTPGDILRGAGTGAVAGGIIGGTVGGVGSLVGGVTNKLGRKVVGAQTKTAEQTYDDILDLTTPELTKRTRKELQRSTGKVSKSGQAKGLEPTGNIFGPRYKPVFDAVDKERADLVKPLFVQGDEVATTGKINQEIARIAQDEIRPFLRQNPRAFNMNQVGSKLRGLKMPRSFKTEDSLERTYNQVRELALEVIGDQPRTMEGLWDARIEFDQIAKREFGEGVLSPEKKSAVSRAIQDMRIAINDYIAEQTGSDVFTKQMRRLSLLNDAADNITDNSVNKGLLGFLDRLEKENPRLYATLVGGGVGLGGLLGLQGLGKVVSAASLEE